MLDFNSYLEEKKKKEVVKINPKKEDLYEKDAKGEDCTGSDHTKSEKKRRKEDVNDGPDVQNEGLTPKDRFNRDAGAIAKKKLRNKEHKKYVNFLDVDESKGYQPEITHSKMGDAKKAAEKRRKKAADSLPPHLRLDVMRKAFAHTNESRLTGANDMQSKLYAANNKSGKKMTDDEIKQEKGGKEFLDRLKAAKSKMKNEGVADRARKAVDHQRKGTHGDDHELDTEMKKTQKSVDKLNKVGERLRADTAAKKLEKKVKSSKNEEAEVYWSSKALDQLDALQKEAYGGKGSSRKARLSSIHPPTAKAAIKNIPDDESDRGSGNKAKKRMAKMSEAKVDKKIPDWKRSAARNARYGNPYGSLALGGGIQRDRRDDHYNRRGKKTKGLKEVIQMTKKAYNKLHKDFKSDDPKKPRTTKYVPGKGTVSMPVKFVDEAKVDKGRSDYGKASIRNYRRKGPGHDDPGMFDPEGKRGKAIELRRKEHKERRGVKGAKVPAYKREDVEMEGTSYGIFKGDGKPKGQMAAFAKKSKEKKSLKDTIMSIGTPPTVKESKGHKYDNSFIEGETGSKRARRNTTSAMNRSGLGMAKPERERKERQDRHKADRGKKTKGTKAGHSGSAYPQRSHTIDTMYPHKKTARLKAKAAARKKLKEMMEGAAWTKKSGKSASGGLNEKGRKSYEKANPGSDLKAPVTDPNPKKGGKAEGRQNSFCKRMKGMKKKLTSKKTANDPDSRINKSLRKWRCNESDTLEKFSSLSLIDSVQTQENVYGSQEKISEKTTEETKLDKTVDEATRYKKETGYVKGGTKKPTTPKKKDAALDAVLSKITSKYGKNAIMRQGSKQAKKVKGAKSTAGTGKYKKAADEKKQLKKDAKEMGYGKDTKGYIETRARYGSKENMKKGRGLGT